PQINSHWLVDPVRHAKLFPADMRPQSHEIIRTWAFYTIAKAHLHEATIPWRDVVISGWILDPERRQKMAKTTGNIVTPGRLLDDYGADGVRYWAASARLGTDTAFDEKMFKVGKRLVTKLFNAGKYVLAQTASPGAISCELDRAFVGELRTLIDAATHSFTELEFADALQATERFLWSRFTDTYLELAKARARDGEAAARARAVATLRLGLDVLLRLFAPILPFITEEIWSWAFAGETGHPSIHRAPWPTTGELAAIAPPADPDALQLAIDALTAINKAKTEREAGAGRVIDHLELRASPQIVARLAPFLDDILAGARVRDHALHDAAVSGIEVAAIAIAPKADAT